MISKRKWPVFISLYAFSGQSPVILPALMIGVQPSMSSRMRAANCSPVLLEPVMAVEIHVPSDATARVNAMVSERRGQILGFDARSGWQGWDSVAAHVPAAELHNLIVDLRSATQGVGTYTARFDHLAELTGKLADAVLAHAKAA